MDEMPYVCWNTHIASDKKYTRVYGGKNTYKISMSLKVIIMYYWKCEKK